MNSRYLALAGFILVVACDPLTEDRDAGVTPDGGPARPDAGPDACGSGTGCDDPGCMNGTCHICRIAESCGHEVRAECYDRMELQLTNRGCQNADAIRAAWSSCSEHCTGYLACRDAASASCACPDGQTFCDTSPVAYCIDLQRNNLHCGSCRNVCPDGGACMAGTCVEG
ncbi:hypothetical protein EDM68_02595 [Candidatus Uhrbacteria bacterium]|nr:MAG: hypothetical protein EDM68_02595 [Candidatus Uhrbacteria bacterium]